jgi:hypothetical protein
MGTNSFGAATEAEAALMEVGVVLLFPLRFLVVAAAAEAALIDTGIGGGADCSFAEAEAEAPLLHSSVMVVSEAAVSGAALLSSLAAVEAEVPWHCMLDFVDMIFYGGIRILWLLCFVEWSFHARTSIYVCS